MNNVKKYRGLKNWTQRELAANTKMYVAEVSRIERGRQSPTLIRAQRIATALGCTVDDLFPMEDGRA